MSYIIKRTTPPGGYVAELGSEKSYTQYPHKARRYVTRAEAEADRCPENERIVTL